RARYRLGALGPDPSEPVRAVELGGCLEHPRAHDTLGAPPEGQPHVALPEGILDRDQGGVERPRLEEAGHPPELAARVLPPYILDVADHIEGPGHAVRRADERPALRFDPQRSDEPRGASS